MKKILFLFIALYLFSLTPIYKKHAPVYFNKVFDFIRTLMSPEKVPSVNRKDFSSTNSSAELTNQDLMNKKISFLNYGYVNKH